jgi:hypothetical protein
MQRLEVSCAVRHMSLGAKGLKDPTTFQKLVVAVFSCEGERRNLP